MPLAKLLQERLDAAYPEMLDLTAEEILILTAYLRHPDLHPPVSYSELIEARSRRPQISDSQRHRHHNFHTYMHRVLDYNRLRSQPLTPSPTLLVVSSWSQLGIGIDEERCIFAFKPAPLLGDEVQKSNGAKLTLPGKRWQVLLELASRSSDGRRVSSKELLSRLQEATGWKPARLPKKRREVESDGLHERKDPKRYLSDTLGDLRRELREQVGGPQAALLQDHVSEVDLGFVVRAIVRGEDGRTRFGLAVMPR